MLYVVKSAKETDVIMTLRVPASIKTDPREQRALQTFLQEMVNRKLVGGLRYGAVVKRQRYMSRLEKELKTYRAEGNREQLLNIAVYAFLESYAPENPLYHDNPFAESATRGTFGV